MEEKIFLNERIIDTLDARELIDKCEKSYVESVEFYTRQKSYRRDLKDIKFNESAVLR